MGAIDPTLGEVTQPFDMIMPPRFEQAASSSLYITPLTSVVWEEVRKLIEQGNAQAASCDSLRANPDLIERIENAVNNAVTNTVRHYNIPADRIFGRFRRSK